MVVSLTMLMSGCSFDSGSGNTPKGSIRILQANSSIDEAFKNYAIAYEKETGINISIDVCQDTKCVVNDQLLLDVETATLPDIFEISNIEEYVEWKDLILPLDDAEWVKDTKFALTLNNHVYGFPISIEGWGMVYNADLLNQAGIDPSQLTNYDAYVTAFNQINAKKTELGIDSVVAMSVANDTEWLASDLSFNSLLSNGLPYGDLSEVNNLLQGNVDPVRMSEYTNWLKLLFSNVNYDLLTNGTYQKQLDAFAQKKTPFIYQGNWIDADLEKRGVDFDYGFAPIGSSTTDTDGIFVGASSWYVINKNSKNIDQAKQFLNDLVYTEKGNQFLIGDAGYVPAFSNITLSPQGILSNDIVDWNKANKIYSIDYRYFTSSYRSHALWPIYRDFATGKTNVSRFNEALTRALSVKN